MKVIKLDARVSGYKGEPVRIIGLCDINTGSVLVSKTAPYNSTEKPDENTVIVTDSPETIRNWQLAYDERQHMLEVIKTYGENKRSGRVKLDNALLRYSPDAVVQTRKIGEGGAVYEFDSQATENGHVAVMLMVWAASRAIRAESQSSLLDEDGSATEDDEDDGSLPFSL